MIMISILVITGALSSRRAEVGQWLAAQELHLVKEVDARAAVNAVPTDPDCRRTLAEAVADTGDIERAIAEFEEGLRRAPHWTLHAAFARFLENTGSERSEAELAAAVAEAPTVEAASLLLEAAAIRKAAGRPVGDLYVRAVDLDRTASSLTQLAMYEATKGHVSSAGKKESVEALLREAIEVDPEHGDALLALALRLPPDAEDLFSRAAARGDARAWDKYAEFLRGRGEYVRMAAAAREAVSRDASRSRTWGKVVAWVPDRAPELSECLRMDAAESLACGLLTLARALMP